MSLPRFSLSHPHTIAAVIILVCLLGMGAVWRMPVDIFPSIDIPVVSVVWTYNGMSAEEMQDRILIKHERQMASLVDDIGRIEANSYTGVGVIKVYLHEGADVSRAVSQLASCAQTVLKSMPRNITPPLIVRYSATDVPVIQLSLASRFLPDQRLTDIGQQVLRPNLAVVHGAQVPYPYGGKPRLIMVDLDQEALHARGLTPSEVADALQLQNVIVPAGDVKVGQKDYAILSLCASLVLSFTLVPVLFKYLVKPHAAQATAGHDGHSKSRGPFSAIHHGFELGFSRFREAYRNAVSWIVHKPFAPCIFFLLLALGTWFPLQSLGMDFFPAIDAGQMRLHVRAPPGTRIEQTKVYFAKVEEAVRKIVGNDQIDVILDNIGLPYSGSTWRSATAQPLDPWTGRS